jgi:hypothetical protein
MHRRTRGAQPSLSIPLPRPAIAGQLLEDFARCHWTKGGGIGQIVAMAREERRIMFDYAEAYKAIYTLCAQKELRRATLRHWPSKTMI